ncbi:uncharacterized protein isoform X3 [Rhodnius prolixus]|uniref:uncharacterized protein isoform X3 n=1 Tax=Rhodnius prolixus TaxID=13249 RepID=UPI003D18ECB1
MNASSQLFVLFLTIILPKSILLEELHEKSFNNLHTTSQPNNIYRNLLKRKVYCVEQNLPISCCTGPKPTKDYLIIRKSFSKKCTIPDCKEKCALLAKKVRKIERMKTKTNRHKKKIAQCNYSNNKVAHEKNINRRKNYKQFDYDSNNNDPKVKLKSASEKRSLNNLAQNDQQEQPQKTNNSSEVSNRQKVVALPQMKVLIRNDDDFGEEKGSTEIAHTKNSKNKKYNVQANIINGNLNKAIPKYVEEFLEICKSLMDSGGESNSNNISTSVVKLMPNDCRLARNKYVPAETSSKNGNTIITLIKDEDNQLRNGAETNFADFISLFKHPKIIESLKPNGSFSNNSITSRSRERDELPILIYPSMKIPLKEMEANSSFLGNPHLARVKNSFSDDNKVNQSENSFGTSNNMPQKNIYIAEYPFTGWSNTASSTATPSGQNSTETFIVQFPGKMSLLRNFSFSTCMTPSFLKFPSICANRPTLSDNTATCITTTTECSTTETNTTTTTEICSIDSATYLPTIETCTTPTAESTNETCITTTEPCTTITECTTSSRNYPNTNLTTKYITTPLTLPIASTKNVTTSRNFITKTSMVTSSKLPWLTRLKPMKEILRADKISTTVSTISKTGEATTLAKKNKLNSLMSSFSKLASRRPFIKKTNSRTSTFMPSDDDDIIPFDNSTSIDEYVDYLNKKCESMHRKYRKAMWDFETNITHQTRKKSMVTSLEMTQFQKNLNAALQPLKSLQINDANLERQIKLLYLPGMASLPDFKITEFEQVLYAMTTIYNAAAVSEWQNPSMKVSFDPVIVTRMAKSRDPDELKYYWLEWRKATGKRIRSLYEQYVELMDMTAVSNGFADAGEMWTRRYETEDFMQLLGSHWEDMRPLYNELHAYVRHGLHQNYGEINLAKDTGTIPVHLTGDLWGEDWRNLYRILAPYHEDYNYMEMDLMEKEKDPPVLLPSLNNLVPASIRTGNRKRYAVKKMVIEAEKMFHSLGFPKLHSSFWINSMFVKSNISEMSCQPSVWDMLKPNDYRMKICGKSTVDDFFKVHEMLAKIEYFMQYQNLSFPFKEAANPSFSDAIAGAVALSVKSRRHLEMINVIPKQKRVKEADTNFLLRMALEKVASLPYSYIIDLWRHRVFQGEILSLEYNKKWWELRTQYQGVSPPVERSEDDFDIGCKLEVAASKPYIKYMKLYVNKPDIKVIYIIVILQVAQKLGKS